MEYNLVVEYCGVVDGISSTKREQDVGVSPRGDLASLWTDSRTGKLQMYIDLDHGVVGTEPGSLKAPKVILFFSPSSLSSIQEDTVNISWLPDPGDATKLEEKPLSHRT